MGPAGRPGLLGRRSYRKLVDRYRQEALATEREYRALVQQGLIREPGEPGLEEIAQGHPDNESVQAARRVLEKRRQRMGQGGGRSRPFAVIVVIGG